MPLRPRRWLPTILMLPLLLLLPTWGDAPDTPPLGACYMGFGKMLEAAQSRQLSLNAHVTEFLYQPGGLEIAYEGSQQNGDEVTDFIRLVGVRRGETTTLVSTTSHVSSEAAETGAYTAPFRPAGWSGNGRYLLLKQGQFITTSVPDSNYYAENFQCVDVGTDPIHSASLNLPDPKQADTSVVRQDTRYWWSPDRTRILFAMQARMKQGDSLLDVFCTIYDPKTAKFQSVTTGERQVVRGWLDNEHLLLDDSPMQTENRSSGKVHYAIYDVNKDAQVETTAPAKMPALFNDISYAPGVEISPKMSYLKLEDDPHQLHDQQRVGAVDAHALWVRRTQGPKLLSAAPVGLTPGKENPKAIWSPNGMQIAFVAHGDLFVTDLIMRDATVTEKYKAGETLTCAEERDLAADNLKQVGLALLQYNQDFDEMFPPSDHWQDRIAPYLGPDTLLSVAGHPAVYHTPAKLSLADMDDPANTILGTIDLPCATVTLYVDGHVKALPKAGAAPAP